jgi:hypothetical protein
MTNDSALLRKFITEIGDVRVHLLLQLRLARPLGDIVVIACNGGLGCRAHEHRWRAARRSGSL